MLTPEVITTLAAYAFGLAAGAGGLAVVIQYGAEPTTGRHHRHPADEAPPQDATAVDRPVPAEQAWARLDESLPPAEAERDVARTPTDDRLRVGPAVSSAETLPMPHAGTLAAVADELVLEYRGGAA